MRKRWTKHDESILIDCVVQAIHDGRGIGGGIVNAALQLQRTPDACRYRYYQTLPGDPRLKAVDEAKETRFHEMMAAYSRMEG